jgi:hypothetical protein
MISDKNDRASKIGEPSAVQKGKPYHSPRLIVYGDLHRLTTKNGVKADASPPPVTKT